MCERGEPRELPDLVVSNPMPSHGLNTNGKNGRPYSIDWSAAEQLFKAGKSFGYIARTFNVTVSAVSRRAAKDGWVRDQAQFKLHPSWDDFDLRQLAKNATDEEFYRQIKKASVVSMYRDLVDRDDVLVFSEWKDVWLFKKQLAQMVEEFERPKAAEGGTNIQVNQFGGMSQQDIDEARQRVFKAIENKAQLPMEPIAAVDADYVEVEDEAAD